MQETLLLITGTAYAAALREILGSQYLILQADDCRRAASLLETYPEGISAVLADTVFAAEAVRFSLPVIAVGEDFSPEDEARLLDLGICEFFDLSRSSSLLLRRLASAVTLHNQKTESIPAAPSQVQEGLRLSLERHQIIMAQTNDIIFELDFLTDTLLCSPKWEERFGYPHIVEQATTRLLSDSHIHPDDIPELSRSLEKFRSGTRYLEAEIRISNAAGQYTWSRLRATSQEDQDGHAIKLVGVIIDIDREKRISQALLDEAARDPLTRLYNRNASRRQIDDYLATRSAGEQAALLVIDLDNFKNVNDHYGHMYGDAVLVQVSTEICNFFRGNDIISRIGGDEFIILMKNIPGRTLVEGRCRDLISAIQQICLDPSKNSLLSCSIGVALVPEHGTSFQDLFQRADSALYHAKTRNKGCFVFYDPENSIPFPYPVSVVKNSNGTAAFPSNHSVLLRHIFSQFFESTDMESTVRSVLELAGKQVNASRAYIFENDPENRFCSNTFEWCSEGVEPQQDSLQHLAYEDELPHYQALFNERGVFYCPDISALPEPERSMASRQHIKSMLQCSIRDNGVFRGFVGFDECTDHRLWTQDQIDLLTMLSQMLSLFLLKNRAQHPSVSQD